MTKRRHSLSHFGGLLFALLASNSAHASDGSITFTGSITTQTCTINGSAAGTPNNQTVTLPTVSQSALASAGAYAGRTPFKLTLTNCSGTKARTLFELGNTVDTASGALINQDSSGSDAQVAILSDSFNMIDLSTNNNSQTIDLQGEDGAKTGTLQYYAQYYAKAPVTKGGAVQTSVQFSMYYE